MCRRECRVCVFTREVVWVKERVKESEVKETWRERERGEREGDRWTERGIDGEKGKRRGRSHGGRNRG